MIQEDMRNAISQQKGRHFNLNFRRQVHVFLEFSLCGFSKLLNMINLDLVLVFDIETTGFLRTDHRIIEFALRDLSGGKDCTFETLINPGRDVPEFVERVHKISTDLVCKPDVPRFSDVLPILLSYVRSQQVPGKPVLWVDHNAKAFGAPFLAQEFDRCSAEIPADWFVVDSLPLARKFMKSVAIANGEKKKRPSNLKALAEYYGIRSEGPEHRAMPDVTKLCQVFQKLTFDLKLSCDGLMNEAVRISNYSKLS